MFVQNHTIKNVVGYQTQIIADNGLFYGTAKVNGRQVKLTLANLKEHGVSLQIPNGVQVNGNNVTFNNPGTYNFVINSPAGRTTTTVVIQGKAEKDLKAVVDRIEVFAGQAFNPYNYVSVLNGASKDEVSVQYISQATGNPVNISPSNVPFGKYTVKYSLPNGNSATMELVAVSAPTNTAGGVPSILVRDRLIVQQGKKVNLKEFAQAVDKDGKNLTDAIVVTGDVNWDKVGKYTVKFAVTDSQGRKAEKTVTVEVLPKEEYEAEISKTKGNGLQVKTGDDSSVANGYGAQAVILTSTLTGMLTLVLHERKKRLE